MRNLRKRKKLVTKIASKRKSSNQTTFAKNVKTLVEFDYKKVHTGMCFHFCKCRLPLKLTFMTNTNLSKYLLN